MIVFATLVVAPTFVSSEPRTLLDNVSLISDRSAPALWIPPPSDAAPPLPTTVVFVSTTLPPSRYTAESTQQLLASFSIVTPSPVTVPPREKNAPPISPTLLVNETSVIARLPLLETAPPRKAPGLFVKATWSSVTDPP